MTAITIDGKQFEELIKKYSAVSRKELEDWAFSKCEYYSKQTQDKLESIGFEKGVKKEFNDKIKDYILLIDIDYKELEIKKVNEELNKEEEPLQIKKNVTLGILHKKFKELLYIEDTKRIDVVLATALSNKFDGIPIWLVLVGASGDMKTLQVETIMGDDVFILNNLTSKSLVNGYKNKKEHPDLAPLLDKKIVIIPDMAQILKLAPVEKGEVWGQLRDLYDGYAGKVSGQGMIANYDGLKVTLIACSTPSIDAQLLIHQDLGTRELIYRTKGNKEKEKVMRKCLENENYVSEIKKELREYSLGFLNEAKIKRFDLKDDEINELQNIAMYISFMRATAEFDNYTNELRNYVYPEEPTRIIMQMKRMFLCLKSLDPKYTNKRAFEVLWDLAKSSAFPVRTRLFEFMRKNKEMEYSTSQLSEILGIGKSTTKRECAVLENIGVLICNRKETQRPDFFYEYWKINPKPSKDIILRLLDCKEYIRDSTIDSIIYMDGSKEEVEVVKVGDNKTHKDFGQVDEEDHEIEEREKQYKKDLKEIEEVK